MFPEVSRSMALLQFMWFHDSHLMRQLSRWAGTRRGPRAAGVGNAMLRGALESDFWAKGGRAIES